MSWERSCADIWSLLEKLPGQQYESTVCSMEWNPGRKPWINSLTRELKPAELRGLKEVLSLPEMAFVELGCMMDDDGDGDCRTCANKGGCPILKARRLL